MNRSCDTRQKCAPPCGGATQYDLRFILFDDRPECARIQFVDKTIRIQRIDNNHFIREMMKQGRNIGVIHIREYDTPEFAPSLIRESSTFAE